MDHREVRNEFGLDEYNERDVQKERAKSLMPWILGVMGLLVVAALVVFALPVTTSHNAARSPLSTTGSATAPQQ